MVFSSVQFVFALLPLALAAGLLLPRGARNAGLALCSLAFCLWGGGAPLLAAFALGNWAFGLALAPRGERRRPRPALAAAAVVDLAPLLLFTYAAFFARSVNALAPGLVPVLQFALPLGLSFYSFQAVGYCVDVWLGTCPPLRSPLRAFLFFGFFAHLPSGPILRCADQMAALDPADPARKVDAVRFCYGCKRFILGLGKKSLLADGLGPLYARLTAVPAASLPGSVLLFGYMTYSLQLYFDFSGYSDMALGLGEMLGLPIPENFDLPYLSRSIAEFWRRWHITLGAWFREYVYFPLGGSRGGTLRTCRNLLIVFALTGLWHGAAWKFVAFGLWHGVFACAERLGLGKALQRAPRWVSHLYTLAVVFVGWVLFGALSLNEALAALRGMLLWQAGAPGLTLAAFATPDICLRVAAGAALCGPVQALFPRFKQALRSRAVPSVPAMLGLLALFLAACTVVISGTYNAFIYAQF